MKEYSFPAKLYIFSASLVGMALCLVRFPDLSGTRLWLFLFAVVITSFTQIFQVEGVTKDSTYNASVFGYSLALLALGRSESSWVALISFVVTWMWSKGKMPWFALGFNIGSATIPLAIASLIYQFVTNDNELYGLQGVIGTVVAGGVYIFLSQLMASLVFWLVEGKRFSESGSLDRVIIFADTAQFTMGASAALIWIINPYAIVLVLGPLYLTYLILQLPALKLRADTDSKTGLYNSLFFNKALEKELIRADRSNHPLSIVMGDLDNLRNVNNTYGHLAGDMVIIATANTIKKLVRNYDIVARFGGEEFAIIMPETTVERAALRMDEIRVAIESTDLDLSTTKIPLRVTMSFGIAEREHSGQKSSEIIHNADIALYQAKQSGRNKVCYYLSECLEQKVNTVPNS